LTRYRSVTDRQTDELTDGYAARSIYNACKSSYVVRLLNTAQPCQGWYQCGPP